MVIRYLYIFFEAMSVWILCLFLNFFVCVYVSFYSLFLKYSDILDTVPLSDIWRASIFSHSVGEKY